MSKYVKYLFWVVKLVMGPNDPNDSRKVNRKGYFSFLFRKLHSTKCGRLQNECGAYKTSLTCVNPGDGAGFGTEEGPVIGCGGLFISPSFVVLH